MKKPLLSFALICSVFLTTACSVMVRNDMVVSPSTEIDETHLNSLINDTGYQPTTLSSGTATLYALQRTIPGVDTTLVVLHGNALNLSLQPWYGLVEALAETDLNILAIDYQGFGRSTGEASFANMRVDARSALSAVPDGQSVILYGLSLGSVAAAELASDPRVKGVILEGGITNTEDMIDTFKSRKLFGSFFTVEVDDQLQFDTLDDLARLDKPVLVIHGRNDQNIPFGYGEDLYAASSHKDSEFYPVSDGGHCDTFHVERAAYLHRIIRFVNTSLESSEV